MYQGARHYKFCFVPCLFLGGGVVFWKVSTYGKSYIPTYSQGYLRYTKREKEALDLVQP